MGTQDVANRLHQCCTTGKFREAIEELYADHARHIEAMEMPDSPYSRISEGKDKLLEMSDYWENCNEVHSFECSKPIVNDNQFVCDMTMEVTSNEGPMAGQRMNMQEICLYTVENDKITEAKFFYSMDC
jgi:hypothetical protein